MHIFLNSDLNFWIPMCHGANKLVVLDVFKIKRRAFLNVFFKATIEVKTLYPVEHSYFIFPNFSKKTTVSCSNWIKFLTYKALGLAIILAFCWAVL